MHEDVSMRQIALECQPENKTSSPSRADLERFALYIIRTPFSVDRMQVAEANPANPDGSIIFHSDMNLKI